MSEQIIKYDCGHMCRRTVSCIERRPKNRHSIACFSGLTYAAYEQDRQETAKFERRATLCPMCEGKGRDDEVYQNSAQRASAPPIEAKNDSMLVQEKDKSTLTKVSGSIGRSNSNSERPLSFPLRRVQHAGNYLLRNECNGRESYLEQRPGPCLELRLEERPEHWLELTRKDGFEARRGREHHPSSIITKGQELDSFAPAYAPLHERRPRSIASFAGLVDYAESIHNLSGLSLSGLRRSTSVLKVFQKGLQRKASDESFVCALAKEVERGEEDE